MDPQRFGRYEIVSEVGRGGMATVYHARDPRFEREVAIKVLPREMLHDPQFRTRFEREAKTIAMLEHPAIVPVYDFGEEDGQPYFVMRYMTGGSLSDRLKDGPMTVKEAAHILSHIAPALDEAHAKGIIHRDLKPGNVLFDQYNEPYVSDFGIAKFAASQTNVTGSAIVGTPAYMSPEQAQGEGTIDGRSDIYGLGVILFEMLSGSQPYQGDTPMSVVVKHITEPVPHILDVDPSLPTDVEAVIEKAMAKDRDERFGTVKALAEALSTVARGETPDLASAEVTRVAAGRGRGSGGRGKTVVASKGGQAPGASPKKGRRGLRIGWVLLAVFLCAAVATGGYLFRDRVPFLAGLFPALLAPEATPTAEPLAGTQTIGDVLAAAATVSPTPRPLQNTLQATQTSGEVAPTGTVELPTAEATPEATATMYAGGEAIGGADLIAFLNANDLWIMHPDGTELTRVTNDGATKHNLQWSPDGNSIFYISGKCIQNVTIPDGFLSTITCFTAADYLEGFEISPDGTQVAISLNRELYVVPFNLAAIGRARNWTHLADMMGCFTYKEGNPQWAGAKQVLWSNDGQKLAVNTIGLDASRNKMDLIMIFDISRCISLPVSVLDNFPGSRFTMSHTGDNLSIPSFDWDGETLFVLTSPFRYNLGYMYAYNLDTYRADQIDPNGTGCCYGWAEWSPDGSYLLYFYQDIAQSGDVGLQMLYVPYGTIGTGAASLPFELGPDLLTDARQITEAILRPAR